MEGGAIAQTAAANNIPFAVLRSVSDGGDSSAAMDYPTFKKTAAEKSTAIILKYLEGEKHSLNLFSNKAAHYIFFRFLYKFVKHISVHRIYAGS